MNFWKVVYGYTPLIFNWFIPEPCIMHTFGDKTLQGGCENKNFEEVTKNHWKKQNPKFFPRRSNYEPKIGHNSGDIGKKTGGGWFHVLYFFNFFQNLSKFKMCAITRLLLKISRESVFDTHEAHRSEFSKTVILHQYSSYSSFWGLNITFRKFTRVCLMSVKYTFSGNFKE